LADGFGPKSAWPVRVCVAAPDSPQRTGSSAPLAGVRRYVTLSRLYVRRPAAARAVRRTSAAVLHSFRRLHITLGNQEPFQSQALARAGRSERAVPLVRYFDNGVRSRLPVLESTWSGVCGSSGAYRRMGTDSSSVYGLP